jgi:hypothetical protein
VNARRVSAVVAGLTCLGLLAPAAVAQASTGTAVKVTTSHNLIRDPGAESAKPVGIAGQVVTVPQWTPLKGAPLTAVKYGTPDFIEATDPSPKSRGHNFFAGAENGTPAGGTQVDSLKPYVKVINAGKAKFALSGWFGGWESQRDYAVLLVTWENASGKPIGKSTAIGDVTPGQRKNATGLQSRSKSGTVPKGATQAVVELKQVRLDGGYDDGYADNLSLVVSY